MHLKIRIQTCCLFNVPFAISGLALWINCSFYLFVFLFFFVFFIFLYIFTLFYYFVA